MVRGKHTQQGRICRSNKKKRAYGRNAMDVSREGLCGSRKEGCVVRHVMYMCAEINSVCAARRLSTFWLCTQHATYPLGGDQITCTQQAFNHLCGEQRPYNP